MQRPLVRGRDATLLALAPALACLAGFLAITHSRLTTLGAGALAVIGVVAASPATIPVLAVPAIWVPNQRVGGLLSVGDAVLAAAAVLVLLDRTRAPLSRTGRQLLVVLGVLLATDTVAVLAHPTRQGAQEVLHRLILVGGGILVGAWLAHRSHVAIALRLLVAISLVFALVAIADRIATGQAAYPLGYHKNFAGPGFATCAILLLAAPDALHLAVRSRVRWGAFSVLLAGLLATSSRGAILGFALAAAVWILRPGTGHRRVNPIVGVLLVLGLGFVGVSSVQQQLSDQASGSVTIDSITQRQMVETATRDLWRSSPFTGVGLRFYKTPEFNTYQAPNNMFDEGLAETGVLGAIGLAVFVVGGIALTYRVRTPIGQAANMVVLAAFFHGQVDLFWSNGQALNWLVVGFAFGGGITAKSRVVGASPVGADAVSTSRRLR